MSAMTLLPCPFCGSSAEYKCEVEWTHLSASEAQHSGLGVSGGSIRHESHRVYCTNQLNCYAAMGGWSADAAVTLWNRRITQPAQSVDVEKVREVISELSQRGNTGFNTNERARCNHWADKLTAALQEKSNG